jgi:uncharacterized protein YfaS (alpha-2-macroglobulin family)
MTRRLLVLGVAIAVPFAILALPQPDADSMRREAGKLQKAGNFQEAWERYKKLALGDKPVEQDVQQGVQCLQRVNRVNELDGWLEEVAAKHSENWQMTRAVAQQYLYAQHHGTIVDGAFKRGPHRGGRARWVSSNERDRVRALQLYKHAVDLATESDVSGSPAADLFEQMANAVIQHRFHNTAWRLQVLTDLAALPDYDDGRYGHHYGTRGAPVDAKGTPVYYHVPASLDAAKNDGERWRWLMERAAQMHPPKKLQVDRQFAQFLHQQFGVQTMQQHYGGWWRQAADNDDATDSIIKVDTLKETETLARLANGVKRFNLPDEFNFIKRFEALADNRDSTALVNLAGIYENRRQYPKAAAIWRRAIKEHGKNEHWQRRLDQIVDNWGSFEPGKVQAPGPKPDLRYRFRNGKKLTLSAQRLDVDKLLKDVKSYLRSNPAKLDHNKINVNNIGYRLVNGDAGKYLTGKKHQWSQELEPRPNHFDRLTSVELPFSAAGAWYVEGKMADGNVSRTIVWLSDLVIVRKPLEQEMLYYVADAVTGKPVADAKLDFFGFRTEYHRRKQPLGRRYTVHVKEHAGATDKDGMTVSSEQTQPRNHQWLITAKSGDKLAHLGFQNVWYNRRHDQEYKRKRALIITDRPVYRPAQTAEIKAWIRHAQYDMKLDESRFAGQTFTVRLHNPKGEKVVEKQLKADEFGGITLTYPIPEDAALGVWRVSIHGVESNTFRIEEYKKPEYEVVVSPPDKPVMLGEKIEAEIKADYFFGAPVSNAKVKYKVMRYGHDTTWYPYDPWDWMYDTGYWWWHADYHWYPGWHRWGCVAPRPWWRPFNPPPPELVAEVEGRIGEDGTLKVSIDTAIAKAMHGDKDHRYEITAEVTDQSRRTIVGKGSVVVARAPFRVFGWTNRGHYQVNDTIDLTFQARTPTGGAVKGTTDVRLLRIAYDQARQPVETVVEEWQPELNSESRAEVRFTAANAGQYRLSIKVTTPEGKTEEGGVVFTVSGDKVDTGNYRYDDLELVPNKRNYKPGEKVKMQVRTEHKDSTVLLFVRPSNGVYLKPRVLRLKGRDVNTFIEITKKDMPNFFVEALTIADGTIHQNVREIIVPPEKRVVDLKVTASKDEYKPGEEATVTVTAKDQDGKPFMGSFVLAVYDRAVEMISGGSNVPDPRAHFWKWRRRHNPQRVDNFSRYFRNLLKRGEHGMGNIGVFGHNVAESEKVLTDTLAVGGLGNGVEMMRKGAAMPMRTMRMAEASEGAPMADMAMAAPMDANFAAAPAAGGIGGGGAPAATVEPVVRTKFADTALWKAVLEPNDDGIAEVTFKMPENLTGWQFRTWAMGHGTRVGAADTIAVTAKEVMMRLQAPRFFVEKDEVVVSGVIHNKADKPATITAVLELDGPTLEAIDAANKTLTVPAGGDVRADWRVKVVREGEAIVRMKALGQSDSDAMEMKFPVYVHGADRMVSWSGHLRPEMNAISHEVTVPAERRVDTARLEVRYSPSLAGAMVDALPYLASFPYGCTEQTLNRFVPTVITQKILLDMGLNLKDIGDKHANLNAQEIGDPGERAAQWKRWKHNPVFDETKVRDMVAEGVDKLTNMQNSDGGWGWFSGYHERSYPHTTATVVHGLQVALENDAKVDPTVIRKGIDWLARYQKEQIRLLERGRKDKPKHPYKRHADNLDALVYGVLADADVMEKKMRDFLYEDRLKLSVYGMALFGVAVDKQKNEEMAAMIQRNIEQYLRKDAENQTAYLELGNGSYWWYWYGSEFEAHASYLKLLARREPKSDKAAWLAKYLLNNRKHSTYWNSTRDTAYCIEALAEYMRAAEEDRPNMEVEVVVDGKVRQRTKFTAENMFTVPGTFVLAGKALESGKHKIELRRTGKGPLYCNSYFSYFSLEDRIPKAGLEVKVNRQFYKLIPEDKKIDVAGSRGQAGKQKVEKYRRELIADLSTLKSGDLVEIEMVVESKNDYEYLVIEDYKAAGFEPVDIRSGYNGNEMGAYVEFRDERVAMFLRTLARGKHSISYRTRAEIPGKFSALPTQISAMYAPELRGNSDEFKINVVD